MSSLERKYLVIVHPTSTDISFSQLLSLQTIHSKVALGAAADDSLRHHWNLRPSAVVTPPVPHKIHS